MKEKTIELAKKGYQVSKKYVLKFLNEQLDDAATPEAKAPIENAIKSVEGTYGDRTVIGLDEFYKVKQAWGKQGRWSELTPPKDQQTVFRLFESSFDLLTHPSFTVPERGEDMIPKPFVLNDAVMYYHRILKNKTK